MKRGTTPTHIFTPNIDLSEAESLYITYQQGGETIIEKTLDDVTFDDDALYVVLSQEETLLFGTDQKEKVEIQIRVKFSDERALASQIITTTVERILKDGEI